MWCKFQKLSTWDLYFFIFPSYWYIKLRFVLKILFGQIFPKSAIVCHRNRGLNFLVFGIRSATGTLSTHGVNTVVFYKTKQKFSCFLEGLKYTKLFCLLWGGWQFRIVNKFLSNYCCLEQGCRPWGCRAPDQLTLSQPEGADYGGKYLVF